MSAPHLRPLSSNPRAPSVLVKNAHVNVVHFAEVGNLIIPVCHYRCSLYMTCSSMVSFCASLASLHYCHAI